MKYSPNAIWWCGAFAAMLAGCKSPDDFVQERAECGDSESDSSHELVRRDGFLWQREAGYPFWHEDQ